MIIFMIDVESIGLHGEAFAVAWLVVDSERGEELAHGIFSVPPHIAKGDAESREWCRKNIPVLPFSHLDLGAMREDFWGRWISWKNKGAIMAADCPWPVESRFLADCIDDDPSRAPNGPYPILDVASLKIGAGATVAEAMTTGQRLPEERPVHNPLCDCRQSMRELLEAMSGRGCVVGAAQQSGEAVRR